MNLNDFVALNDAPVVSAQRISELQRTLTQRDAALHALGAKPDRRLRRTTEQSIEAEVVRVLSRGQRLEDGLLNPAHPLAVLNETPRADLGTLRAVADAAGFAIYPAQYMREALPADAQGFVDSLSPWFQMYALAPASMYSVEKQVASDDLPTYLSREASDHLLRSAVVALRERATKEREKAERKRLEDPMLLAVPAGADVRTFAGIAFVGPCWGPDMAVTIQGLALIQGQRKLLERAAARWAR